MKRESNEHLLEATAIIRTDRLGDMILTLPMCKAIRKVASNAKITLITKTYVKPILYECEVVDEIIYLEQFQNDLMKIYKQIKPRTIFFPRPRFSEIYYSFRAKIENRVGTSYRWYSFLLTHKVRDHRKIALYNEAEYNIRLIESFTNTKLKLEYVPIKVEPESLERMNNLIEALGLRKNYFVILHPGTYGSSLNWPIEKFIELSQIISQNQLPIILTGTNNEMQLGKIIQNFNPNVINLIGRLNLYETIALISLARGLVANSTGILHIASVLEIPTVGVYPNTAHLSAKRWGPIGPFSSTLSPPRTDKLDFDNMDLIPSEQVFNELVKQINLKFGK
ncbi:MAG: glycosyltransferase family 9 protein [Ignavibacteria bacterium]|nr:glycosyltransferase family 9 protein [Ignavibacteria bacterium]